MSRIEALDVAAVSIASKTTAGGGVAGLIGFVASINWLGVSGFAIAILGYATNLYFQRRRDKRDQEEHAARMIAIQEGRE